MRVPLPFGHKIVGNVDNKLPNAFSFRSLYILYPGQLCKDLSFKHLSCKICHQTSPQIAPPTCANPAKVGAYVKSKTVTILAIYKRKKNGGIPLLASHVPKMCINA
ncbi:hypothetical protein C1H46_037739 [Malus baccata]|uniref:Uncharacterized protein n=1 Tax=Malus baccata TaxID=106549 RepID=A0A540KR49_MALBA|nr:hypothetical protein C1H46_037739 [Malus baccata]